MLVKMETQAAGGSKDVSEMTNLIPQMTSATAPSGSVTQSRYHTSGYEGFRAFGNYTYGWNPMGGAVSFLNDWVQYEFPSAVVAKAAYCIDIDAYDDIKIALKATNTPSDANSWKTLTEFDNKDWNHFYKGVKAFNNETAYKYYRWVIIEDNTSPYHNGWGFKCGLLN